MRAHPTREHLDWPFFEPAHRAYAEVIEERLRSDSSVTALVNNAGFGGVAKLIDSDVDDMDNMIQLNVTALTRLTSAALPGSY